MRSGSSWVNQIGAQEDQAAGAAFALGGSDPGLSAADLFLQVGALAALGMLQLYFLGLQLLLQGLLAGAPLGGGSDPGLSAADLFLQVGALAALGMLQLYFLELVLQGLLPGQQMIEFFLRLHSSRW